MKKLLGVLLGLCLVIPAVMAADVSDINKQAWLSHIKEMNVMRRQIIEASKKANNSAEDMAAYNELMTRFETKQVEWDEYITAVANDDEEGRAKVENRFQGERPHHGHRPHHPRFHKHHHHAFCECCKCTKCECEDCRCCTCEKCECRKIAPKHEHKCHKAEKCCGECPKAQKCEKKCMKAEKCGKCPKHEHKCHKAEKCGECPKAQKCEKKCMKAEKCGKCPKAEKKCHKAEKCGECPKAKECHK